MYKNNIKIFSKLINNIPIIDRWLFGQLIPPLLFAVSAFTVVSLSVGVMFDLIRKIVEFGLPITLAVKVMFLKLPGFLVLSFPMSVLLSTLLAYGKMSSNSEILAARSLGVKTSRLVIPAIILAIFMTGLTFYFNNSLVPLTNKYSEILLRDGLGKSVSIEKGHDIFFKGYGSYTDPNTNESTNNNTLNDNGTRYINNNENNECSIYSSPLAVRSANNTPKRKNSTLGENYKRQMTQMDEVMRMVSTYFFFVFY